MPSPAALARSLCLVIGASALAWVGCSDGGPGAEPADAGGGDAAAPPKDDDAGGGDAAAPPKDDDADAAAGRDCADDIGADGVPKHLECTGLYASLPDKTLASDVRPYTPGVEFWSDGADKQRWVFLPPGGAIDTSDFDEWRYPVGTKLWKEFKLGGKRIETRYYTKRGEGSWGHTAYRWNDDETDAVRKDGGEKLPGAGPNGGIYEIPNTGQCNSCHMGRKDEVLGFDAVSLGLATAKGVTLATLAAEGRLTTAPPKTTLAFPGGDQAAAAVGWLHANCGACHNANPNADAAFVAARLLVRATELAPANDAPAAEIEDLELFQSTYCRPAFRSEPDYAAPYLYLRGGEASRSLVSVLSGRRVPAGEEPSTAQMPPLVTRAVDTDGHGLLNAWITSLPPCP